MPFPPVYQTIFDRYQQIQKWAEGARESIRVRWSKQGKALVHIGEGKEEVRLAWATRNLYDDCIEANGIVTGFERNVFIRVQFEKSRDGQVIDSFSVLLTDADIILVC